MSNIVEADRTNFHEEVKRASTPVVVEFATDWCKFCTELEPVVEELADEYEGSVKVVRVDVEENGRLANEFHIADLPTFFGYFKGNSLKRKSGNLTADDVEEIFDYLVDLPLAAA